MRHGFQLYKAEAVDITILILLALLSSPAVLAAEPLSLGHGKSGEIVNLERGAAGSAIVMPFLSSGFVAPAAPQAMELDPGALVHQSRRFRDDSAEILREAYGLLNQTIALALQAEEAEGRAKGWANESEQSANLSFKHMQDAQLVHDRAYASLRRLDQLTGMLIIAEMVARQQAAQPNRAYAAEALQQEINDIARRLSALEERIREIEKVQSQ